MGTHAYEKTRGLDATEISGFLSQMDSNYTEIAYLGIRNLIVDRINNSVDLHHYF